MDDLVSICQTLIDNLRESLMMPDTSFNIWFGDLSLDSLSDTEAIFLTPNDLRKKILSTKYKESIVDALSNIIGFRVSVRFEIRGAKENTEETQDTEDNSKRDISLSSEFLRERHSVTSEYTFDNFIEGTSNKFAKAACFAVANEPCYYNPLFIYGHSGLGKTHLLYAVINHMTEKFPELKIVYRKSEDFINEMIDSIREGKTFEFKDKYRTCDVLLIDDIQFIAGKEAMQEEFFHTFSALYEAEKQIILTSDRPPMDIKPLSERLRSRFEGGLIADVQPPSIELRTAIIKKKASDTGLIISDGDIDYLANRLNNNIRQIEGVIKKLYAIFSITGKNIDKEDIESVISVIDPGNIPTEAVVERIIFCVAKHYGLSVDTLKSKNKSATVATARQVAAFLIRDITKLPFKEIGKILERDHSTIISSIDKVSLNLRTMDNFKLEVERIKKDIEKKN
ncbi:MAG: chromosomal replication initiator protein DnaA [Clostridia bacterium]|nr:chromosomal replication initiator protein DnaA [Clostridia bacterium]